MQSLVAPETISDANPHKNMRQYKQKARSWRVLLDLPQRRR